MAAEESFHAIFREVAHLLELVNRYDWNRLARLYELKCILKRRFSLRREDIKGELGHSIGLRRHCQPDTAEEVGNPPASLFGTCRKPSDNGGGKSLHELREIANVENVDVKRLTLAANFMEEMMDETCLAISARSHERDVSPVPDGGEQLLRFRFSVTEILRAAIAFRNERILIFHEIILPHFLHAEQLFCAKFFGAARRGKDAKG